jgi:hypothetical protein
MIVRADTHCFGLAVYDTRYVTEIQMVNLEVGGHT